MFRVDYRQPGNYTSPQLRARLTHPAGPDYNRFSHLHRGESPPNASI